MNYSTDAAYAYWLANVPGIGNRIKRKLTDYAETAQAVYEMPEKELKKLLPGNKAKKIEEARKGRNVMAEYERFKTRGINFVCLLQSTYPKRLAVIEDAPFAEYYYGNMPSQTAPSVAVIGARQCSEYGRYMAKLCGSQLAQEGVEVISGMARGIDGIGQSAALAEGGKTYGVLGCGVDICYPEENREIYERMKTQGGILSEYPPGMSPSPQLFPPRNRIISGLSDVVVIIEAKEKSGTLITADMALEQGKEVYVIPGRTTDSLSEGCNRLIKQGAGILLSIPEMLEETGLRKRNEKQRIVMENGQKKETGLMNYLDFYPKSIEQLQDESGMEYREILCQLMSLCMENKARQVSAGHYQRIEKI